MAADAYTDPATDEIPMLPFAETSAASSAVAGRQPQSEENLAANPAGNPYLPFDLRFIRIVWIEIADIGRLTIRVLF